MTRVLAVFSFCLFQFSFGAECTPLSIPKGKVLLVTHAYTLDKKQIDKLNLLAKKTLAAGGSVVYLTSDIESFLKQDFNTAGLQPESAERPVEGNATKLASRLTFHPTYLKTLDATHPWRKFIKRIFIVKSLTGELGGDPSAKYRIELDSGTAELLSVGGNLNACLDHSRAEILGHMLKNKKNITLNYVSNLISKNGLKTYTDFIKKVCNLGPEEKLPDFGSLRELFDFLNDKELKWRFAKAYLDKTYAKSIGFIGKRKDVGVKVTIDGGATYQYRNPKDDAPTITLNFL